MARYILLFPFLFWFSFPLDATLSCPQPGDYKWVMPSAAIIAVGGGAIAGYGAGTRREKTKATPEAEVILNGGLTVERSLEWITPSNEDADGPIVRAEIFTPMNELYAAADLGRQLEIPPIPSLGTTDNPAFEGQYTIVFTAIEEGATPSDLGGIIFQGVSFYTPNQNFDDPIIPRGTQATLVIDYPTGPLA